jgi:hypothetical protein
MDDRIDEGCVTNEELAVWLKLVESHILKAENSKPSDPPAPPSVTLPIVSASAGRSSSIGHELMHSARGLCEWLLVKLFCVALQGLWLVVWAKRLREHAVPTSFRRPIGRLSRVPGSVVAARPHRSGHGIVGMADTRQSNIPDNGSEQGNTNLPAPPKPLKPPQGHDIGAPAFFTATLPWRQASWPRRALWLFYEWLAIMAAGLIIQGLWLAAWWRRFRRVVSRVSIERSCQDVTPLSDSVIPCDMPHPRLEYRRPQRRGHSPS